MELQNAKGWRPPRSDKYALTSRSVSTDHNVGEQHGSTCGPTDVALGNLFGSHQLSFSTDRELLWFGVLQCAEVLGVCRNFLAADIELLQERRILLENTGPLALAGDLPV